jgi:hypothetical protein
MEILLSYVWRHKILPLQSLRTTQGETIEVVHPGTLNTNAGPDFFNAKIKRNGILWVGNVEIHDAASDWYLHGHDKDKAYDNVILHVVEKSNRGVCNSLGNEIPQLELPVPEYIRNNYEQLLRKDAYPPCHQHIRNIPGPILSQWMGTLQYERLSQRAEMILQRAKDLGGDWEKACFITLARNFGFGINGDAFEQWGKLLSTRAMGKIRDDLFRLEALFFGQAGLLDLNQIPEYYRDAAQEEGYLERLEKEYAYMKHVYGLTEMSPERWRFLRLRPQNFPHMRIAQLASLYQSEQVNFSKLIEQTDVQELVKLLDTTPSDYWRKHYVFGSTEHAPNGILSPTSRQLVVINTVVPLLYAYGMYRQSEGMCERAMQLWEGLKAENNHIVRAWSQVGLCIKTAADSQAVLQLQHYCDRQDCLHCRIGYEYLCHKREYAPMTPGADYAILREEEQENN